MSDKRTLTRSLRALVCLIAVLILGLARIAGAAAPTMAERAIAYAAKYNLPVRQVALNVPGREAVKRIFVPVTAASHDEFLKEFTAGGAVIRQQQADAEHVTMALQPNDLIHNWGRPGPMFPASAGGLYIALDLSPEEKAHFKATVATAQSTAFVGKNGSANCTRWLVHGNIGPEKPLAHKFGIKRANAPSNLIKKLIHAGNDAVVVGVAMPEPAAAQAPALRTQLANHDANIQRLEAQIANLEAGGRAKAFETQAAPLREAIAKLTATIAERQEKQPAIAAGLQTKKAELEKSLTALTEQHEAPYRNRMVQLDQVIVAARAKVDQAKVARDQGVKAATDQLAAHERALAELVHTAPGAGPSSRYDRKLVELDQSIAQLQGQIDQGKPQREAARTPWRDRLTQGQKQLEEAVRQAPQNAPAKPGDVNAFNQRIAQLDQTANNVDAAIKQHQAQPGFEHQVEDWKRTALQARQEKEQLVQRGVANFNPQYEQRLAQVDQQIAGVRTNLNANPVHASVPAWLNQLHALMGQRDTLVKAGPQSFNPQYEQRIAQIDQQIAANTANINAHAANPAQKANVASWRVTVEQFETLKTELTKAGPARYDAPFDQKLQQATTSIAQAKTQLAQLDVQEEQQLGGVHQQLAQRRQERDALAQRGPQQYHPEYDAEVARLDQIIAQSQAQVANLQNNPAFAAQLNAQKQTLATTQEAKTKLLAIRPTDYNPPYEARLGQLDQTTNQLQAQITQLAPQPLQQAQVVQLRHQLEQNQQLKAEISKRGPNGYDPQFDQKLVQATQQVTNAKAQVEAQTAQHQGGLDAASQDLARNEALKAELARHGSAGYNPAYDQRVTQLDQTIAQLENNIRGNPQPQQAPNRLQWTAQIEQNKKLKEELIAKGPEKFNPNEPQIQQLRIQIEGAKTASGPLRIQLAQAEGGNEVAQRFAAIPDQVLMGPPPGAGAAEAIH